MPNEQIVIYKIYKPAKQKKWQTFKNRRRPQYKKGSASIQNHAFLPYYPPVSGYYGPPTYGMPGYGGMGYSSPGYIAKYLR